MLSMIFAMLLKSCDIVPQRTGMSKGFWRMSTKIKNPELRHTILSSRRLSTISNRRSNAAGGDRDQGIEAFLAQNHGEGWMLPETLRLADYGLGHDDRAQHPQPVASRLGPRFYDWQLFQTADESWQECHLHARNLLGAEDYARLLADLGTDRPYLDAPPKRKHVAEMGYSGRPGADAVVSDSTTLPEVAEPRADYDVNGRPKGRQTDMFE